ncbi:MAG: phosphate transport system protein [Planctomycetota bacterium]|jgi:phosphate transport system protein
MMRWLQRLGPENRSLHAIHSHFLQMLEDGRHIFDAAANALVGGTNVEVIEKDLYKTDRRINATEQAIRREIVVHGSIHGAATFPALLVMMSLVKDAERIGDYCKNIYQLACMGCELGTPDERKELIALKDRISRLIVRAHGIYKSQDEEDAKGFLEEVSQLSSICENQVRAGLKAKGENKAGHVLIHRYFKRVISHTGNIVTSVVMPLDKLDYFDEPKK